MQNKFVAHSRVGHGNDHHAVTSIEADMRYKSFVEYGVCDLTVVRPSFVVATDLGAIGLFKFRGHFFSPLRYAIPDINRLKSAFQATRLFHGRLQGAESKKN
jgi:hypothetical protein